jgi:hypothetical protein
VKVLNKKEVKVLGTGNPLKRYIQIIIPTLEFNLKTESINEMSMILYYVRDIKLYSVESADLWRYRRNDNNLIKN